MTVSIMRGLTTWTIAAPLLLTAASYSFAAEALSVLGEDYTFPTKIDGLPEKLSGFKELQINSFQTSDGVKLSYWEAGRGHPLVFLSSFSSPSPASIGSGDGPGSG